MKIILKSMNRSALFGLNLLFLMLFPSMGIIGKEITEPDIITRLANEKLPGGEKFEFWKDQTNYRQIFHVAQNHPKANDNNDGSVDSPFFTIQKAAGMAGPGDMVLIHEGTYRETVRPVNSGRSEKEMICFIGAEGEKVIVTGAEIFKGNYTISEGWAPYRSNLGKAKSIENAVIRSENDPDDSVTKSNAAGLKEKSKVNWTPYRYTDADNVFHKENANVYMFKFPRGTFIDTNPFAMVNGPLVPWVGEGPSFIYNWAKENAQKKLALMKRGMLFCDGQRLTQVSGYLDMAKQPGTFFVEDDGLTVHLRLPANDKPDSHLIEFTAREQCFCPENRYSSFIRIENITFNKGGNGFSPPQSGILSTNCGNHFIINNCVVEDANGVGLDIGFQLPSRYSMADRGYQVVTNCVISRSGMAGICGTTGCSDIDYYDKQQPSILIAFNRLYDNCWQDFSQLHESAAIKLHHLKNSMLSGNFISGTKYGHAGIWLDAANENVAIRENVILKSQECGIYIEASTHVNEVSDNIIADVKEYGIKGSETDHIHCFRNIILGCKQGGINIRYGGKRYFLGETFTGEDVNFFENIISDCEYALLHPTEKGFSDKNIFGDFSTKEFLRVGNPQMNMNMDDWQEKMGWDKKGIFTSINYSLEQNDLSLKLYFKTETDDYNYSIDLNSPIRSQIDKLLNLVIKNKIHE